MSAFSCGNNWGCVSSIRKIKSCARGNLWRSTALFPASPALAACERFQLPRSWLSTDPTTVKQYILDATDTAVRLDGVTLRDDREASLLTLKRGQQDYDALLKRRESLTLLPNDAAVVDFLLDGIQARLKFTGKRI